MAYTPPIGIPDPADSFGWEIDRATPAWPASWTAGTPSATAGFYYIDKTASGATDTANPYGYPGKARLTPPEGLLTEGAFVYIHAGTYLNTDSGGDRFNWHGAGTSANPIWITGNPVTKPIIREYCHIGEAGGASYFVFENFEFNGSTAAHLAIYPAVNGDDIDHILVRNCVLTGTLSASDSSGIGIGLSSGTDTIPDSTITHVVVYNCTISNYGDPALSDQAGVYNGYHTDFVWVLGCTIFGVGADCVAGSHYSNYTTRTTEHYFIGGNTLYQSGENAIDLKAVRYGVISENEIYGPFTREQGWGVVLHYGADGAFYCRDCAIIFNRIHGCSTGIALGGSSGCDNLNIVGNFIYDIHAIYGASPDTYNGYAVQLGGSNGDLRISDNTIHDCDSGVYVVHLDIGDTLTLRGNIFSNVTGYSLVTANGEESRIALNYDLYSASPTFFWQNASRNLAYMQGTALQEVNAVVGDPLFADAGNGDFEILTGSPAIDASNEGSNSAYDWFLLTFGISILFDASGAARPVGAWDTGALEFSGVSQVLNITTLNATTLTVG